MGHDDRASLRDGSDGDDQMEVWCGVVSPGRMTVQHRTVKNTNQLVSLPMTIVMITLCR